MSQSSVIASAIMAAFFLYITVKGQLPRYLGIFVSSAQTPQDAPEGETKTPEGGGGAW